MPSSNVTCHIRRVRIRVSFILVYLDHLFCILRAVRANQCVGMCVILLHATHLILRPPDGYRSKLEMDIFERKTMHSGGKKNLCQLNSCCEKYFVLDKNIVFFGFESEKKNFFFFFFKGITLNLLNTKNKSTTQKKLKFISLIN